MHKDSLDIVIVERKLPSKSIAVSDDGQSLMIRYPHYGYFVKVPYFHHLSTVEQDDVLRICRSVDLDFFAKFVNYNYDKVLKEENGSSYVVDNVRYILSLPESGSASVIMKFLLLSAVGKMKFLSKRNINLFFVESDRVMEILDEAKSSGNKLSLDTVFNVFDQEFSLGDYGRLYQKCSEELFYLRMILVRWLANRELPFREIVMMQTTFGYELPAVSRVSESGFSQSEILLLAKVVDSLLFHFSRYYDEPFDLMKVLFDDSLMDGLADATAEEMSAYLQFFVWVPPLLSGVNKEFWCSIQRFKKEFLVDFSRFERSSYVDFFFNNIVDEVYLKRDSNSHIGASKNDDLFVNVAGGYYFLFCLLNGDEEKFIDFMKVLNTELSFRTFSEDLRYSFLNMVREYSELDYSIPASLLFNMHGVSPLLDC